MKIASGFCWRSASARHAAGSRFRCRLLRAWWGAAGRRHDGRLSRDDRFLLHRGGEARWGLRFDHGTPTARSGRMFRVSLRSCSFLPGAGLLALHPAVRAW